MLAAELGELASLLPEYNIEIDITGFDSAEIDTLAVDFADQEQDPADEFPAPENRTAVSGPGDLWTLGCHRLLCGDSRDETTVRRLMGRELAAMVFADPPYNVRIGATVGRGKIKHREFPSASGEMSPAQFIEFLPGWMKLATHCSVDGSIHYACIDWRHLAEMLTGHRRRSAPISRPASDCS
jgi:hypothetical protein